MKERNISQQIPFKSPKVYQFNIDNSPRMATKSKISRISINELDKSRSNNKF